MITAAEILKGRDSEFPLSAELQANLVTLLASLNLFRQYYGRPLVVTSGYRPGRYNEGYAPWSTHQFCQGVDFRDRDGSLAGYCVEREDVLAKCGLYLEDPRYTLKNHHVHLQTREPESGKRIFRPY